MSKKHKVGSGGRFGPRYGNKLKNLVSDIEKLKKARHECPRCKMNYVVRESAGIWKCEKCGNKFAGMAYKPKSA
jgi:large subunit ribosomal protein L37Ae